MTRNKALQMKHVQKHHGTESSQVHTTGYVCYSRSGKEIFSTTIDSLSHMAIRHQVWWVWTAFTGLDIWFISEALYCNNVKNYSHCLYETTHVLYTSLSTLELDTIILIDIALLVESYPCRKHEKC